MSNIFRNGSDLTNIDAKYPKKIWQHHREKCHKQIESPIRFRVEVWPNLFSWHLLPWCNLPQTPKIRTKRMPKSCNLSFGRKKSFVLIHSNQKIRSWFRISTERVFEQFRMVPVPWQIFHLIHRFSCCFSLQSPVHTPNTIVQYSAAVGFAPVRSWTPFDTNWPRADCVWVREITKYLHRFHLSVQRHSH